MGNRARARIVCQSCGYESSAWMGRCPHCQGWGTMVEEAAVLPARAAARAEPGKLSELGDEADARISTGSTELDRVLGGGAVPGSVVLIGGDPGIGKSTLLLQAAGAVAAMGRKVLYISGEESARQIARRAARIGTGEGILVMAETSVEVVEGALQEQRPDLAIIDSVQTMFDHRLVSAPGSVGQVRECAARVLQVAKSQDLVVFLVGHVTKSGDLAGPRVLEHIVDTVLYFEGERHHVYRLLRAVKNRFGSTSELGVFEMTGQGLIDVLNPSQVLLAERPGGAPGSVVVAAMEGTRPLLVEVQALVAPATFGTPRRTVSGVDQNRVALLLAVLERKVGMNLGSSDAYVKVSGGVRLDEPAADLGIILALASSYRDACVDPQVVVAGEVGLTGEIRLVSGLEQRAREAAKLGFGRILLPASGARKLSVAGMEVRGVDNVDQALAELGVT
ncbi:MAG: DNA repair protein RadA [Bacillota bacterium]